MEKKSKTIALSRASVLSTVWPIILANASAPLLGIADTAVIGRNGSVEALGAIALGSLIFSFVYWSFGFLRMTTTGFVAQADGAGQEQEVRLSVLRPLVLGGVFGIFLWLLQAPIHSLSFWILDGTAQVEALAGEYFRMRIWGAPAALATYAVVGTLIGLEKSRLLLFLQVFTNGLNIALDLLFAGPLDMGVQGVAVGTTVAEWSGLLLGLWLLRLVFRERSQVSFQWAELWDQEKLRGLFAAQFDIMLRTLLLLAGFAWFTNQGAKFGDEVLAANHVLLQLVSFSAFVLDGFAFATESLVGRAEGAGDPGLFDRALRLTSELAALSALMLAGAVWVLGPLAIEGMTDLAKVQAVARSYLGYAAVYVALSAAAFQLDGVFIGVTRTREMRNAVLVALLGFLLASLPLIQHWGNHGLWVAFIGYVVFRAVALGVLLPGVRRGVNPQSP